VTNHTTDYSPTPSPSSPQNTNAMSLDTIPSLPPAFEVLPRRTFNPFRELAAANQPRPAPAASTKLDEVDPALAWEKKRPLNVEKEISKDLPYVLSDAQKAVVRTAAEKGTARVQIAHRIIGNELSRLTAAKKAINELLDTPDAEVTGWWKQVPGRKVGTVDLDVDKNLFLKDIAEVGGFGLLQIDEGKPLMVRVEKGIVEPATRRDIKLFIKQEIEALPERFSGIERADLLNLVLDKNRGLFDAETLDFLPTIVANFIRDTATKSFLFLENGWVEITATTKEIHPYGTQPGHVWKSHIQRHSYVTLTAESYEQCDFHLFMRNIFGKDPARLRAAQLAQGYLLHNYKEFTNTKCIVHEDKVAGEGENNGRSGKTLLTMAVAQLRKVAIQDGRQFDFGDNFRWQKIERDTEVFAFDEWKASQPFEPLFSTITGDWAVNKKNQPEFTIPFLVSPKMVISTNAVIVSNGESAKGRILKIAVDNHYHATFTPEMEIGRAFFGPQWDEDGGEWNRFINLAISWVQLFLANNRKLESVELEETKAREFLAKTDSGFPEFLASMKAAARAEKDTAGDSVLCIWLDDAHALFARENGASKGAKDKREFSRYMKLAGCAAQRVTSRKSTRYHQMYFTWGESTE
jgi:hypothetical protein